MSQSEIPYSSNGRIEKATNKEAYEERITLILLYFYKLFLYV